MVNVNLLPWREALRIYQVKKFKQIIFFTLIINSLFLSATHMGLHYFLLKEEDNISHLQNEINRISPLAKINSIDAQQSEKIVDFARHHEWVNYFFTELSQLAPQTICFTEIIRSQQSVILKGYTPSAAELTAFLQSWRAYYLFSEIKISQLEWQRDKQAMLFNLSALVKLS